MPLLIFRCSNEVTLVKKDFYEIALEQSNVAGENNKTKENKI